MVDDDLMAEDKAKLRLLGETFEEYAAKTGQISQEILENTLNVEGALEFVDNIANESFASTEKKQKLLEEMEKVACERFRNRTGENPKYILSL